MTAKHTVGNAVEPIKEPIPPKKLRFVEVVWLDAVQGDSWAEIHGELDASVAKCITRGWLIREDAKQIHVAATLGLNADGDASDVNTCIAIPKGMLEEIVDFPRKKARKKPVAIEKQIQPWKEDA